MATTHAQTMSALGKANQVRLDRATKKQEIRDGEVEAIEVLSDLPAYMETILVVDFLEAIPRYGPSKITKLLKDLNIPESKTVGKMTPRQRTVLINKLR